LLTDLNFFTAAKPVKFATKGVKYFQHLTDVAALPWEVKSPNLLKDTKELEKKHKNENIICHMAK